MTADMSLLNVRQGIFHLREAAKFFERANMPNIAGSLRRWADESEPKVEQPEPDGAVIISMATRDRVD